MNDVAHLARAGVIRHDEQHASALIIGIGQSLRHDLGNLRFTDLAAG